jgi:hypothetical protein
MQVTVVGNREGRLFQLLCPADQIIDPVGSIQERVFGMAVEVDEGHLRGMRRAAQPVTAG